MVAAPVAAALVAAALSPQPWSPHRQPEQPPQYGQPQYGDPQYGQPQYGQPQYGQPQYGQPQYGQQDGAYGPPSGPEGTVALSPSPSSGRRTRTLALTAAAVVVLGGGAATYVAVSSGDDTGAGSPRAAVQTLVSDLNSSDLVGLLDDLPPGERAAISAPVQRTLQLLKKNDVIAPGANLGKVSGVSASVSGLTFAPDTVEINESVQIVQLTGGTIRLDADAARLPFSQDFLRAVAPSGTSHDTVDIGKVVARSGHPLRIATQKVDGRWYPSLLYTIADNAVTEAHLTTPTAADRIPAKGASTPDDAVRSFLDAALAGNVERAGELLSPDELAVLHDYGKLIVDRVHYSPPHVAIKDLQFTDTPYSGGVRVSVRSVDAIAADGSRITARLDGDCADVTMRGQTRHVCVADEFAGLFAGDPGASLTAGQKRAIKDMISGALHANGLDVTQTGGSWYLNPIRTVFDVVNAVLSGLQGDDAKQLLELIGR